MSIYRSEQFCKEDGNDIQKKRSVIFLDIDGVLQPTRNERRFQHRLKETARFLREKYDDEIYLTLDRYDVAAVYYDWDLAAVGTLKKLIEETCSEIVIHSSWIYGKSIEQLKALFRIHDLDMFITGFAESPDRNKKKAIRKYLEENPDVKNYVVIDDDFFVFIQFGEHGCWTREFMNGNDYEYCMNQLYSRSYFEHINEDDISQFRLIEPSRDGDTYVIGKMNYKIIREEKDDDEPRQICLFSINLVRSYNLINDYITILTHAASYFYEQDIYAMITDHQKEMDGKCRLLKRYMLPGYLRCEEKRKYESVFLVSFGYHKGYDCLENIPEDISNTLKALKDENRWM
ncbi:HAD domain-containing protein [[Clostridium] innocuum]|nr:HAD domain-containing protein [[Clostridium] innocuum]